MKLFISFFLFSIFLTYPVHANFLDMFLKEAAIKNGYKIPKELNSKFDEGKATIGKKLFESSKLSLNGDTSCSSCHLDKFSSSDGIPNAIGVGGEGEGFHRLDSEGALVPRNTLPLWGRASKDFSTFFWDGKVELKNSKVISQFGENSPSSDPLTVAIHLPFVEIREMVVDDTFVNENLKTETVNSALSIQDILLQRAKVDLDLANSLSDAFSIPEDELEFVHLAISIKHFFAKKFALKDTRFSKFISGDSQLTDEEILGGITFYGKGMCSACHSGPHFTDFKFHTIALPQAGPGKNGFGSDYGRFNFTLNYKDLNKFRTPPLHNVVKTGPYGHSGSLYELTDTIIGHYDPFSLYRFDKMTDIERRELYQRLVSISDSQPVPSNLTEEELNGLISFLDTLSF